MALKVKAKETYQNVGKYADTYRYVMMPELYIALAQEKVINHLHSQHRAEGRTGKDQRTDYQLRQGRQGSEACDQHRRRHCRGRGEPLS